MPAIRMPAEKADMYFFNLYESTECIISSNVIKCHYVDKDLKTKYRTLYHDRVTAGTCRNIRALDLYDQK